MTLVSIAEASLNLASLIELAQGGEEVIIAEGATPLVRLTLPKEAAQSPFVMPPFRVQTEEEGIRETYGMSAEEFYRKYPEYAPPPKSDQPRVFGSLEGKIWMSDDFDAPLEDFEEYM